MNYDAVGFTRNLIKGRIAESLFDQMLRDTGRFTILAFGYENVLPELAHRQNDIHAQETMEVIRRAPDFAVINNDTHDVHLIEVKYMMHPRAEWVYAAAKKMYESWRPAYLFLATPKGFFLDKAKTIVENQGKIAPLGQEYFSQELQQKYINLLNEFIVPGSSTETLDTE